MTVAQSGAISLIELRTNLRLAGMHLTDDNEFIREATGSLPPLYSPDEEVS